MLFEKTRWCVVVSLTMTNSFALMLLGIKLHPYRFVRLFKGGRIQMQRSDRFHHNCRSGFGGMFFTQHRMPSIY